LEELAEARGSDRTADPVAGMKVDVLEWSWNPWRDRPGRAIAAAGVALGTCALVTSLHLPPLMALVLCLAAVASFAAALVPVRCRLDAEGATRRNGWVAERRAWRDLERAERTAEGLLLSPFRRAHWLESYRALFLPIPTRGAAPAPGEVDRILASHGL
jgi:hypothetical protein